MADSAMEHFQGSYHNPAMYVGPMAAAGTMLATLRGGDRNRASAARTMQGAATMIGLMGLGFHGYNILKRPGGLSWNNLFYAAPVGAPGALALAGVLGLGERRMAGSRGPERREDGRILGGVVGASLLVTTAEIALLHFRGAFHNPAMFVPVTIPPAAGAALCLAGLRRPEAARRHRLARALLHLTALLGPVGTAFHAFGVSREMGGWANWRQSLLSGPPMPAPASLTGLALPGLAALREIEGGMDE
ncbi:hypothetical protein GI374_05585 [Paracoccus sp. S-4012]|nr:hypothetical protein [Paracoccus sp. S-4012]